MPTAYGYARASTEEQEVTILAQVANIKKEYEHRFAGEYAWGGVVADRGISGKVPFCNRPEGYGVNEAMKAGDMLIITKMDRAFRSVCDLATMLEKWKELKIRVIVMDLNIDLGTTFGVFAAHLLGALAQLERDQVSDRMLAINAYRRSKGLAIAKPPYGYKWGGERKKRKHIPDPAARVLGKQCLEWYESGWTYELIYFHFLQKRTKRYESGRPVEITVYWISNAIACERKWRDEAAAQVCTPCTPGNEKAG